MTQRFEPSEARSVRLFLVDGTVNGIIRADPVRNALVFRAPRSRLKELYRREEANRCGVYILSGYDIDDSSQQKIYIGETDCIKNRIPIQEKHFDFFDRVAVAVGKDDNLSKNHFRYIESELIRLASGAGITTVMNGNRPEFGRLSEGDRLEAQDFLDEILLVLPLLGLDVFRTLGRALADEPDQPVFETKVSGTHAFARETDDGFLVLVNSTARAQATETFPAAMAVLRDKLLRDGKLIPASLQGYYQFATDVNFSSPSAAASIIGARNASGPLEWRERGTGRTYKQWREAQLAS